jgi:hypothetical protein
MALQELDSQIELEIPILRNAGGWRQEQVTVSSGTQAHNNPITLVLQL